METKAYDAKDARAYIIGQFKVQGDFLQLFDEETLASLIGEVMALDEAYMQASGANADAVYDDDDAYEFMHERISAAHPEHKMYMMRLVEDYMDFNEQYLESIGAIEWE